MTDYPTEEQKKDLHGYWIDGTAFWTSLPIYSGTFVGENIRGRGPQMAGWIYGWLQGDEIIGERKGWINLNQAHTIVEIPKEKEVEDDPTEGGGGTQ